MPETVLYPVVVAGGGGTRLWPLSCAHYPKQFQHFRVGRSLLQQARRACPRCQGGSIVKPMGDPGCLAMARAASKATSAGCPEDKALP